MMKTWPELSRITANEKLERRAADVILAITNAQLQSEEENEVTDMCQALVDMRKKAEEAAKKTGDENRAQSVARNSVALGFDTEQIAHIVGYAPETVTKWLLSKAYGGYLCHVDI